MIRKIWTSIVLIGVASIASAGPRGTVPKSSVGQYRAHAERDGVGIGAVLLASDQVRKTFASDVNRCCLVVEVAFYPAKDKPLAISLDDLTMQAAGSDALVRPLSARAVAATLQEKAEQGRAVTATTAVGVGYESGTYIDPVTDGDADTCFRSDAMDLGRLAGRVSDRKVGLAYFASLTAAAMASPRSLVLALPPMSGVRT